MKQQLNTKLQCQQQCHQQDVDMVCYNKFCTEPRLNCFNCIKKGSHKSHIDDVEKINTIVAFIENQNKQCDNLIDNLDTHMKSVNQSFSQLKNGIKNKYSLLKERLENLNSQQVNDFLKSTFEFPEYKQSIIHIIQEQSNQLTQTFGSLHQQLQLLSINYDKIDDKDIKLSKELYDQGFQLYMDDKYREAIQILKKSLQSDPNNNLSLWCQGENNRQLLGECLSKLDKYESAINQLDQELVLDPKNVNLLWSKGFCLLRQRKNDKAIIWLDQALAIDPKHIESLCFKGECLRQMQQYEKSIGLFDQALSINRQHASSLNLKGKCLTDFQNYKEAQRNREKALYLQQNNVCLNVKRSIPNQ